MKPSTPSPTPSAATGAEAGATGGLTPPSAVPRAEAEAGAVIASCTAFAGSIIEISAIANAVPVSIGGSIVSAPYWLPSMATAHTRLPISRSSHPAAVPTRGGSDVEMTVKIEVTKAEGLSGTSTLRGRLAGVEWTGSFPSSAGTHTVTVRLTSATTLLAAHRGDIDWQAEVPGCGTHPVGRTRVEIYRISDDIRPPYLSGGRPIEALQLIYDKMGVSGVDVASAGFAGLTEAAGRVTTYLHSGHGLSYDTEWGAAHYLDGATLNIFRLTEYMGASVGSLVNCYDQASAVQVFAGVLGIDGFKRFTQVFGLINTTVLVGSIRTNNPFFRNEAYASDKIVERLDPRRSYFRNHQFFLLQATQKVFDACAGPALGGDGYIEYIENAVDTGLGGPGFEDPTGPAFWRTMWLTENTGGPRKGLGGYWDDIFVIRNII